MILKCNEEDNVINTILTDYGIFLENMFVNHLEQKNISINDFISFVIKMY